MQGKRERETRADCVPVGRGMPRKYEIFTLTEQIYYFFHLLSPTFL
jgi:hypothetical protein